MTSQAQNIVKLCQNGSCPSFWFDEKYVKRPPHIDAIRSDATATNLSLSLSGLCSVPIDSISTCRLQIEMESQQIQHVEFYANVVCDSMWTRWNLACSRILSHSVAIESRLYAASLMASAHYTILARRDHRLRMWISRAHTKCTHRFISDSKSVIASGQNRIVCGGLKIDPSITQQYASRTRI